MSFKIKYSYFFDSIASYEGTKLLKEKEFNTEIDLNVLAHDSFRPRHGNLWCKKVSTYTGNNSNMYMIENKTGIVSGFLEMPPLSPPVLFLSSEFVYF